MASLIFAACDDEDLSYSDMQKEVLMQFLLINEVIMQTEVMTQVVNETELLKQILPTPSNQVLENRFASSVTEASCRPTCSGHCVGFISAN